MKWTLLFLLPLGGCAGLAVQLPEIDAAAISAEQSTQEKRGFEDMQTLRAHLEEVAAPILKANVDLCSRTGPYIGAVTHTLKSYPKKLRLGAARELGAQDEPSILIVPFGSPADKAGLKAGDILKQKTAKPFAIPSKALTEALEEGARFQRIRAGEIETIDLKPVSQCDYAVELKMTPTINAYATGKTIIVTSGMMKFVKNDEELAAIVGHELAHNELKHIRKTLTNLVLSGFATRYTRAFESEADYVGLYYTARAGYDIDGVEDIWRRLSRLSLRPIARAKTHPTFPDRYVRLAAARSEINAKRKEGLPLLPNYKDRS